ncbi:MAG: ATP-dependent DNA helicase [Candidatus Woesearchaeota archaeon]|nr:ATP-dependent DNA helicase [Candidatus Woesearchaeota archaeon]
MNLFPHETVRQEQDKLLAAVKKTVEGGSSLVAHAPTGLGKTAAALAPALEHAIEKKKLVLFLTSRLTQHKLAMETVKLIKEKHNVDIPVVDLIGKKHMCLQKGVENLKGKEFTDYCKSVREDEICEYYNNLKTKEQTSAAAKSVLVQLGKKTCLPEEVKVACEEHKLCPYEITMLLAKSAAVIVMDYSYIFNPRIREGFFARINKELADCIVIVDEGHNLPDRVKELATERITTTTLKRAIKEAETYNETLQRPLTELEKNITQLADPIEDEAYLSREELLDVVASIAEVEPFIMQLEAIATAVREEQKTSSCGVLAEFLAAWMNDEDGYTRILAKGTDGLGKQFFQINYRCLDPSVITTQVFNDAHSSIVMSGTLTPVDMYEALLGLEGASMTLQSPFAKRNRLNLVLPKTTTKFTKRSDAMTQQTADICTELLSLIPGNVAIFFPSYKLLQDVQHYLDTQTSKTVLAEHPSLTKEEREHLLTKFRASQLQGAVLLGVMGGSFAEGIDLPGNELRGVIVVGLPLGKPDLETKALIDYYDEKFGKGWAYGYTFPAFNRTLQSAGRCIRTETDRGAIIFLDERYAWQNYMACFPKDWDVRVSLLYKNMLEEFFAQE